MRKKEFLILLIIMSSMSCVTPKVYKSLLADHEHNKDLLKNKEKENLILSDKMVSLNNEVNKLKEDIALLKKDSVQNGKALISLQKKYDDLNSSYDILSSKSSREISRKAKEVKMLLDQLEETQSELLLKENKLNDLSISLSEKEKQLNQAQLELDSRSKKVIELEKVISQQDSLVSSIKNKVSKALTGLEGDGLTIEQRNGKIYISLEEDLLFASGKYEINNTGIDALNKLSEVLAIQKGIEILVEGHTDNIPLGEKRLIKDNWDLSVMRATSVVKILLMNSKLDPLQLTAAGRGEHNPIANNETSEGRKMNRRIEMIVSPDLDDLYEILE